MSRQGWFFAGVAFGAGLVVGYFTGVETSRAKFQEEYTESMVSYRRALKLASETEKDIDQELISQNIEAFNKEVEEFDQNQLTFNAEGFVMTPTNFEGEPVSSDYEKAVNAIETPVEVFVDGGINDYGISYIEEEDYFDEDGREKHQITIMMDEHNPIFLMGGTPIDDWDQRVGDSILVDFYKLVPPGVDPILYVRNHRTDEDYEVIRENP